MAAKDDDRLLQRLLSGEQKAFRELVTQYQGAMRCVAFAIVGSRHVDDVVQEAWLAAVRNLRGFEGRSSLKTWILTITANAAKCRYLQNRRDAQGSWRSAPGPLGGERFCGGEAHWRVAPVTWHEDTPEALLGEEAFRCYLEDTLQHLPPRQSSVLLLRERQGLELEAIAGLLGLSLSNVRVSLHRARLKVFAAIEEYQSGQA